MEIKKPFPETSLKDVAVFLKYQGLPKSLEDMQKAIGQGIQDLWYRRS